MPLGRELVRIPEVPFPRDGGVITRGFKNPGKGQLRRGQAELTAFLQPGCFVIPADIVNSDGALETTDAMLIASGEQRAAGRSALRRIGVILGEAYALPRNRIDDGSSDIGASIHSDIAPAEIVGHDQDDIRPSPRALGHSARCGARCKKRSAGYCGLRSHHAHAIPTVISCTAENNPTQAGHPPIAHR